MYQQAVIRLCAFMLVLSVNLPNLEANVNVSTGYELAISKVESRLSIASKMLENARRDLRNGTTPNLEANVNVSARYELAISKADSRLNLASNVLETATRELRNDLKQLDQNNSCRGNSGSSKGQSCHPQGKPMDCGDIYLAGYNRSGIYQIWPQSKISNGPLQVYCDMEDGGGWTVIQRRGDFGNPQDYFYLEWNEYKIGFGHLLREFWIGNDNLFSLTGQRSYQLKVDLTDWEEISAYAIYEEFWLDDEVHKYTLHVKYFNGTAGDSLGYHNGKPFSTKDRKNDNTSPKTSASCAVERESAWWYDHCANSNLNGIYHRKGENNVKGITWYRFRGAYYSLKETVMKIRPASFNAKTSSDV